MIKRLGIFGVFLFSVAVHIVPAESAEIGSIVLNAVAYKPIPAGTAIAVLPLDNSDENLSLQREFEYHLKQRGYRVSAQGVIVLTFEMRNVVGSWSDSGRRTIIELEGRNAVGDDDSTRAMVNIYNSKRGGVFNKGRGGIATVTPSQFRLDVSLDTRQGGKRLWQAWSVANQGQTDGLTLTKAMVPVMVGNLGQTVRSKRIALFGNR